jgi:hypothetical protein
MSLLQRVLNPNNIDYCQYAGCKQPRMAESGSTICFKHYFITPLTQKADK